MQAKHGIADVHAASKEQHTWHGRSLLPYSLIRQNKMTLDDAQGCTSQPTIHDTQLSF
jgi:hypothetical protein